MNSTWGRETQNYPSSMANPAPYARFCPRIMVVLCIQAQLLMNWQTCLLDETEVKSKEVKLILVLVLVVVFGCCITIFFLLTVFHWSNLDIYKVLYTQIFEFLSELKQFWRKFQNCEQVHIIFLNFLGYFHGNQPIYFYWNWVNGTTNRVQKIDFMELLPRLCSEKY